MQMAYVSIVGSAGYAGQETLDRVLRHPDLELYAVGSDSLAGRDATALDPRLCRVVELKFFAGLTIAETATALDVSTATVERDWTVAKAWLHQRLSIS